MKPEDRARLDAAIEHAETIVGSTHNIYEMRWIRGIIDEQDAEIARLKTQSENQARIIDTQRGLAQCGESKFEAENETLKEQRAEERAKREAIARQLPGSGQVADIDESLSNLLAKVADYRSREGALTSRADKAERELAEERAAHARADAARANLRDKLDRLAAHSNGVADEVERWCVVAADWKGRAEKAEVRTIAAERELERWRHGSTVEGDFVCPNELRTVDAETRVGEYLVAVSKAVYPGATKHPAFDSSWILTELANTLENYRERVAELQAFVDAGDTFRFGRFRVFPQYIAERGYRVEDEHGDWLAFDVPKQEAIALARDLAVKEKEPK